MPVFDFSDAPDKKNPAECTYTTFQSSEPEASPEKMKLLQRSHPASLTTIRTVGSVRITACSAA